MDARAFVDADGARAVVLPEVRELTGDVCGAALERGVRCVVVPHSVEVIGAEAFAGFDALEEVDFARGSRLREVGDGAFRGCRALVRARLPVGVQVVGTGVFEGTGVQ